MADETPATPEVPEALDGLSDDELRGLHAELDGQYQALRAEASTPEHVESLRAIRAEQTRIAGEVTTRIERIEQLTELDASAVPLPEVPAPMDEDEKDKDEPTPVPTAEAPVPEPAMSAALTAEEIAAQREPQDAPKAPVVAVKRASLVAPAGSDLLVPGTPMDFEEIGRMADANRRGSYGRTKIASIAPFDDDPDIRSMALRDENGARMNDALIRESVDEWRVQYDARRDARHAAAAHTAAICDPLDIIREIPDCVQATEPFSDSLPSRAAGRMGFQYTPSMSIGDMAAGVDVWDETDQDGVDPDDSSTWKPCVPVTCPTPASVIAKAIVGCFTFDNTTDMSNPERIRDAMSKINALRARVKTATLLKAAEDLSHHFEFAAPYGALPGVVQAILTTLPQGEYPERLDDAPYVFYTPPGMLEALIIDRVNRAYSVSDAERTAAATYIEAECAAAGWNVSVIDLEDVPTGDPAPFAPLNALGVGGKVALPGLGGTTHPFKAQLLAPESALYFSTGEINMGIERSPELNRQNRAQWFAEEYVGLAKHGCHPWYVLHFNLCPNGSRAGLATPYTCSTSGS